MKIACIGGGPGGLYFALLMKKLDPAHEIDVYERNGPHDTFGWGVVFSEETLSALREADLETYLEIRSTFAHWDSIDVHYKGERVQCGGHVFCGIARIRLLEILQEHCQRRGIRVHFHREVESVEECADADLILACDGVNSKIRKELEHAFQPTIVPGRAPYVWLGTNKTFEAFTFIIAESEHGVFQVHAYAFDEKTSTFIVECDEATLARSGLEAKPIEETVQYFEKLFAPWLDGNPLLTNKSSWIRFQNITLASWHHENVVILGDAAHTAHYSVGSGTKLAVESAIALAKAFESETDVRKALARYEQERRLPVAKLQRKALQSQRWFEEIQRYCHFEPLQFAFSLMTRSRALTHENLKVRDRAFVDRVDRWFADHTEVAAQDPPPPPMFTPFRLRELRLENRVVVSPMCQYTCQDGTPNDWHLVHLGSRAVGGAGLVMAEMTNVAADARISPGCAGLYTQEHAEAWRRVTRFVHEHSASKIGVQLGHAGRKGSTKRVWEGIDEPLDEGNWPLIAPSPLPYLAHSQVPKAMDRDDMERVIQEFERATRYALEAEFDLVEVHMAHGYLLASFLSPFTNRRTDEYGGPIENRMRFPLEVFEAVRRIWPQERPVAVRISAVDWIEGGMPLEDSVAVAHALKTRGCDLIDVSSGQTDPSSDPVYGRCYQAPFSDRIRNEVGIPTMTVGAITTVEEIDSILAAGRADLCALARPHLAQPYFTLHAAALAQDVPYEPWPAQYMAGKPRP